MEELWNVPGISHCYLFVCILETGVLVYRGLELQYHQRDSVDVDYSVGSTKIGPLDRQLIDDTEDVVLGIAEIDELDVQGGLLIIAGDSETATDAFEGLTVVHIWSTIADMDERYCLSNLLLGDAYITISAVQKLNQIVCKQDLRIRPLDGLSKIMSVSSVLEKTNEQIFQDGLIERHMKRIMNNSIRY